MFTKTSYIKRKIRDLSLKIFHSIENNGNCVFDTNGENIFINNLLHSFKSEGGGGVKVVFDIGANIGEYSQMIEDQSDGVNINLHLFEPATHCFDILSKKFKGKKNVILNSFGVSDNNSTADIFYDKEQSGLASLYKRNLDAYNSELNQSEKIILMRLDNYITENNIKHIHFIKMDIEGHELKAFEGLGKYLNSDFIDYIQFEYGGANLDANTSLMEMYKFLKDRGFSIAKVLPTGLEIREYQPWMDNFCYANYVAMQ